jgi:hypothetical protein
VLCRKIVSPIADRPQVTNLPYIRILRRTANIKPPMPTSSQVVGSGVAETTVAVGAGNCIDSVEE